MAFTATPVDGSGTPIPMSSAVPDGTNTPLAIEGGPSIVTGGNTLVPVSMYIKDGNDVTQGLQADAAVTGDNPGTASAKLRGLNKTLSSVTGVAGTPASGVVSVQGITSMTPLKVDGSGVTQAVNMTEINGTAISNVNPLPTTIQNWQSETPTNLNEVNGAALSNSNPVPTQDVVGPSGGSKPYHNLSAATTNFTNTKGVPCQMYGYMLSNTSAAIIYVKFYDKATTPATTDTPAHTMQVAANSVVALTFPEAIAFLNGFGWAATANPANNDNTAIAANCIIDFRLNA